ncbi:APC family permease [Sporosarcina contaminans]|uniref:APC family permease n=1 Tax=Sporosarcina contaminans TaxID=633403 RepID=A0ABW3U0H5_9BACL
MQAKIGLIGAISTLIGTMVGAAIFILLGPLADQTGPSLTLSFLLGAIPALFGSAYYMQLGSMFPSTGGSYVYASRLLNPTMGIITAFFMIMAGVGAIGMLALGFVNYLSFFIAGGSQVIIAISIVLIFVLVNLYGMKFANKIQIVMVAWMLIALLIYIVFGFFYQHSAEFIPIDNGPFLRNGVSGLMMAAVLAFYSYAGYGLITEIGGEIKNPQKNTPRAILISLVIVTLIYMGVSYISTSVVSIEDFISFTTSLPMAASLFLPGWVVTFIAIGGLLAIFTTLNAIMLIIPHEFVVMAKEGVVSKHFARKHKSFGTPYLSLLIVNGITIVLIVSGISETVFATMTVAGLLLSGIVMGMSALNIFKKMPDLYEKAALRIPKPILIACSFLGIVSSLLFTFLAVMDAPIVGAMALALAIIGVIYSKIVKVDILTDSLNKSID